MLKISLVLCMFALTSVGCATTHQTKTTTFAKANTEETVTVKKDVISVRIMSADMKVVYDETFDHPTTVICDVCPRNPVTGATMKTEYCLMWSNTAGDQFVTGLRSGWIVAYMSAYTTSAQE